MREKALLGELKRQCAQLQENLAAAQARATEAERAAADPRSSALERENASLKTALAQSQQLIDDLRKSLKIAQDERDWLGAQRPQAPNRGRPQDDVLSFFRTTPGLSQAARVHLCTLINGIPPQSYNVQSVGNFLVALVGAYVHRWNLPPGTCFELEKALQVPGSSSYFGWLLRHSPLISKAGNAKKLVVYELHLERLGWDELPDVAGRAPWVDEHGRVRVRL